MNKRVAAKKKYFSFLSDLSDSRIPRTGLYLIAGIATILLGWFIFSGIAIEAATVFGILALFIIPIAILLAVFIGLEKLTGLSCLRGIEWVGRNTLLLVDWIVLDIQKLCGVETHDKTVVHAEKQVVQPETPKTYGNEPAFDFEALATDDPLLGPLDYKPTNPQETAAIIPTPVVNMSTTQPIVDNEPSNSHIAIELPEIDESSSIPPTAIINNASDKQAYVAAEPQDIPQTDEVVPVNTTIERVVVELDNEVNPLLTTDIASNTDDKAPYLSADIGEPLDMVQDIDLEDDIISPPPIPAEQVPAEHSNDA
ncbi:MAG: hypothetical protein KAJ63_03385, partial [Methyloprofundus sp.]|nr:hypothetical protein [Methyloprofundus sp.]